MPFYERAKEPPKKGTSIESAVQDFKREMNPNSHFTLANDVAAFANHLGGTLWVGIVEDENGSVGERPGIPPALADDLQTGFTDAIKDRCSPRPVYDFDRFPSDVPDRSVLAVFVEPYVGGQLIGVGVKKGETNDKYKGDSYVFPIRSGKATKHLMPEQLLMFTEPRIRRVFIQLSAIPQNAPLDISKAHSNGSIAPGIPATLSRLDPERNAVHVTEASGRGVIESRVYGIDQVRTVHGDGVKWYITLDLV